VRALRRIRRVSFSVFLVVGCTLARQTLHAQGGQDQHHSDSLVAAARGIMETTPYCALITLAESGQPHVRTMDPFLPDDDMVVWFGTHRRSRKVQEIRDDPRVAIHYLATDGTGYVTLAGTARIVDDPSVKERYWKSEWEQFYPNGKADYVTIAVTPETLEVVDYSKGIAGDLNTWKVPSVKLGSGGSGW
jgi:general stress protein 26